MSRHDFVAQLGLSLGLLAAAGSAAADTIRLKNGEQVEGEVIQRDELTITVKTRSGAQLPYLNNEIELIEAGSAPTTAGHQAPATPAIPTAPAPTISSLGDLAPAVLPRTKPDRATLEARVAEVLALDNVSQRKGIDAVFQLGDFMSEEGNAARALELYEAGLRVDSWRLEYQLKAARLVLAQGRRVEAIEKAKTVYQYTESPELMQEAKGFLAELGTPVAARPTDDPALAKRPEIVLVPVGGVRRWLLEDFRQELQTKTGLKYSIAPYDFDAGPIDRTYASHLTGAIVAQILAEAPPEQVKAALSEAGLAKADLETPKGRRAFLEVFIRKTAGPEQLAKFRQEISPLEQTGQRDAERLIKVLAGRSPVAHDGQVKGYVGVLEADLFVKDNNFVFGWAGPSHGVMSYHRFLAEFNGEPPNRTRLRSRFVKQVISSTFYVLGIERCTSATCMRAYPNDLTEHDQKENELCARCKEKLRAVIGPL